MYPCFFNLCNRLILVHVAANISLHQLAKLLVERIQRVVDRQITGFRCLQKVLALVLDMKLKSSAWLRAALFIPYILSLVIVGFIWKFIFMQGFESLGHSTGWSFFQLSWLGEEGLAFFSILVVSIWQSIGFYMVIYIAGLQSVPDDLKEAAIVDGAGPIRRFFSIILPLLAPSITISVFMALTNSIKVFDVILSLTGGDRASGCSSP